jgi:hypothetical protein
VGDRPVSLLHLPLSWDGASWPFRHPLDFLGSDGGGGIGGGPGISVGATLALRGTGRLPVGICGDGDFLMGVTALWTAAHYRIPLLVVVANNQSFFNDEVHQERVARMRNRPIDNKWIGMRISDPDIDMAALAQAQGAQGFGPVHDAAELEGIFATAITAVRGRGGCARATRLHANDGQRADTVPTMSLAPKMEGAFILDRSRPEAVSRSHRLRCCRSNGPPPPGRGPDPRRSCWFHCPYEQKRWPARLATASYRC